MAKWGYDANNGPATWCKTFPIAEGNRQSPINIVTSQAEYNKSLEGTSPLTTVYTTETDLNILNTGASVKASIKGKSELTGGPLKEKYKLEQFHLHWGSEDNHGSEHTIDGQTFGSELHLVHWNCDKYKSFGEAADKPDGLAVLGIMIKAGKENPGFKNIASNLCKISKSDSDFNIHGTFNTPALLPSDTSSYWTYEGSLTTPPLYESVTWIVFKDPVEYSPAQLECLRSMKNGAGQCLKDNFRPPTPLKSRTVVKSFV